MANFWADPERLRAVAPKFAELGADVESAVEKLRHGLDSEHRCWGSDQPGKQFEQQYPQGEGPGSVGEALAALGILAGKLKATGDKITGAATAVRTQEQNNAEQYRRV
ncbi:WXG100 family type VII secretion target [Nocardia sp. NPDC051570]|uniref:WXG100 family type VII secretion target n=1 Tax=Nocardia sp. NPDC051570 TaxID=3364324 RepID=UPI0037BCD998